jgi:hypothetical protein
MERLVEKLQTPQKDGGLKKEEVTVFLNSADDVHGAYGALRCGLMSCSCLIQYAYAYSFTDCNHVAKNLAPLVFRLFCIMPRLHCLSLLSRGS